MAKIISSRQDDIVKLTIRVRRKNAKLIPEIMAGSIERCLKDDGNYPPDHPSVEIIDVTPTLIPQVAAASPLDLPNIDLNDLPYPSKGGPSADYA